MTPTFAVGLGVVIAAGLASNVSGSLLRYPAAPDPGVRCAVPGCKSGKGGLASAKPGKRLLTPTHSARPSPSPAGHRGNAAAHSPAAPDVAVEYWPLGENGSGSFSGYIVITSRSGRPLDHWTFRFSYSSAQITGVWAGASVRHDAHSATVTASQGAGGNQVQIFFSASGRAGPPAGCSFDGSACQFTVGQGSGGQGSGGQHDPGGQGGGDGGGGGGQQSGTNHG